MSLAVYLYTPELYPTRSRALGVGTATAWLRLASIIGPTVVGTMVASSGLKSVFLVFAAVALAASLTVALFAVETKGRVLEEISP
jgi:putative MFS transporter